MSDKDKRLPYEPPTLTKMETLTDGELQLLTAVANGEVPLYQSLVAFANMGEALEARGIVKSFLYEHSIKIQITDAGFAIMRTELQRRNKK